MKPLRLKGFSGCIIALLVFGGLVLLIPSNELFAQSTKKELGQSCSNNNQCKSGFCDPGKQKCVPVPGTGLPGQYCTVNGHCASNLCCNNKCTNKLELGERCDCLGDIVCKSGKCDMGSGSNGTKKCVPPAGTGSTNQYCSGNEHCKSLLCISNKCAAKREIGEP